MKISFFAPSYKRPIKSITQTNYDFVNIVVAQSESGNYINNGNNVVVVPDNAQGNFCRIRNYVIDNLFGDNDAIVLMDDDCKGLYRWENQTKRKLNKDELFDFVEMMVVMSNDLKWELCGVNCVTDKGAYMEHTPFNTLSYVGSPFHVHIRGTKLRYDERFSLKEDYDITLEHIHKHGGILRANFVCYDVKQAEQIGGCATYRNKVTEMQQFKALQSKWGTGVITYDSRSKRGFDFNPIMRVPLKGV